MRPITTFAVLLSLCTAVPAFSQNGVLVAGASSSPVTTSTSDPTAAPTSSAAQNSVPEGVVDLTSLKETVTQRNKALSSQVTAEKTIVKKNGQILQDAKKIDAANKKLEQQRKLLEAQNLALDKERQAMIASQKSAESAQ